MSAIIFKHCFSVCNFFVSLPSRFFSFCLFFSYLNDVSKCDFFGGSIYPVGDF